MNPTKKRILFNIHYLEIGGAETSLIGLFHSLKPNDFNIDLLINDPRGELMQYIPNWINIIPAPKPYNYIESPLKDAFKSGLITLSFARLWAKYKYRRYLQTTRHKTSDAIFGYVGKYVTPFLPSLNYLGEYDLAISYVTPHNIVLDKIKAKKKIAWIHTDYTKIDIDTKLEFPVWNGYDKIISISSDVTKSFLSVFPSLESKIIEIENFIPVKLIKKRREEFVPDDMPKENHDINILTIGRYCEAKRIDEIPFIAKILNDSKIKFKWYIIGYGNHDEYEKIIKVIKINKIQDKVILLGKKENPYPYMKYCDIYVQPSRYEGKSITVREAQLLGKPVVITNYPTAASQINDGFDGLIGPYDTFDFAKFLVNTIKKEESLKKIKENLKHTNFSQQENIQKFYSQIINHPSKEKT